MGKGYWLHGRCLYPFVALAATGAVNATPVECNGPSTGVWNSSYDSVRGNKGLPQVL